MNLPEEIAQLQGRLQRAGGRAVSIATAESATAGRIADQLTGAPGASDYFLGGIVAYSNDAKMQLLGVSQSTLDQVGAVSALVACEMADGGRAALGATVCVSDTGIAGPGGATANKPVGLFFVGIATAEGSTARELRFNGDRTSNKEAAARACLTLLRDYLLQCCEATGANDDDSV